MNFKDLLVVGFLCFFITVNAQDNNSNKKKGIDPKYVYAYKETSLETDDYSIFFVDGFAQDSYSKVKIRIFNKTNDYLIFKPSEFSFKINGQDLASKDKQILIPPNEEVGRVIDVKGHNLQCNDFTIEIKAFYKVAANSSTTVKAEDFVLPPTKNDFTAGAFNCKLADNKLKSEKSSAKFVCTYSGDGIGIIDPYKCAAIMPKNNTDNANARKYSASLLEKGSSEDFVVEFKEVKGGGDMQKQGLKIKWNDTFKDAKLSSLKGTKIDITLDQAKTADKNK